MTIRDNRGVVGTHPLAPFDAGRSHHFQNIDEDGPSVQMDACIRVVLQSQGSRPRSCTGRVVTWRRLHVTTTSSDRIPHERPEDDPAEDKREILNDEAHFPKRKDHVDVREGRERPGDPLRVTRPDPRISRPVIHRILCMHRSRPPRFPSFLPFRIPSPFRSPQRVSLLPSEPLRDLRFSFPTQGRI